MDYSSVLNKSLKAVWNYRTLWLFGIILALTASSGGLWLTFADWDDIQARNTIQVLDDTTIYFPGEGLHIDLTNPDGVKVYLDEEDLRDVYSLGQIIDDIVPADVWTVVIIGAVWITILFMMSLILRYMSTTALIGMVDQSEEMGGKPTIGQGLRVGFSRKGWRIFFLDLLIFLATVLGLILIASLFIGPLFLLDSENPVGSLIGIATTSGLAIVLLMIGLVSLVVLSLFVQVIRRAYVQDDKGVFAGIRRGIELVFRYPGEVLVIWLIWIGVRLAWLMLIIPVMILLSPILILMVVLAAIMAAPVFFIAAGISSLFMGTFYPWVIGGIFALPVFLLVIALPLAFVNGLVEIFKSNLWTFSFRQLRSMESDTVESGEALPKIESPIAEAGASGIS